MGSLLGIKASPLPFSVKVYEMLIHSLNLHYGLQEMTCFELYSPMLPCLVGESRNI